MTLGLAAVGVAVLAAASMLAYAVLSGVSSTKSPLSSTLEPYERGGERSRDGANRAEVWIGLLRAALERAARIARLGAVLDRVETRLEQANLPLRGPEAFILYVVSVVVCDSAAFLFGGPLL